MALTINPITDIRMPESIPVPGDTKSAGFREAFEGAVAHAEATRSEAGKSVERLISGETGELHSVALAAQRAELEFELFLQVKNKVVQAYQEIMRMQL
jgi:flagellar hook-basal body complex protein FliE